MCRVDHDQIHARVHQRLGTLIARIAHRGGCRHAQAAQLVLASLRVQHGLLKVFQRQQSGELAILDNKQFLNAARLHQRFGLGQVGRRFEHREIVRRHHRMHRRFVVGGEAHVAVGHDADHAATLAHHWKARDFVAGLQLFGVGQRLILGQCHRIIHDPAFEPFDAAHLLLLLFNVEIAVDHPNAARLRHGYRHPRLGHRVHGGGQKRDVHRHRSGHEGPRVGGAWHDAGGARNKQNIVKCEGLANLHEGLLAGGLVWQFAISRNLRMRKGGFCGLAGLHHQRRV